MDENDQDGYQAGVVFRTKNGMDSLKPKGFRGVKLEIECLNLETKEERLFESIVETERYLRVHFDNDKAYQGQIGRHLRKSIPVPFHGHLFRVATHSKQPWPSYEHVDLKRVTTARTPTPYPIYIKNIQTGRVHTCKDFDDVLDVDNSMTQQMITMYLNKNYTHRGLFRYAYNVYDFYQQKPEKEKRRRRTYSVYDSITKTVTEFTSVKQVEEYLDAVKNSINTKFFYSKSSTVYHGGENRYVITRKHRDKHLSSKTK